MNDRAALDALLRHGPLSRTRLGELTGLSKPTASQLLARLEAAGLVIAIGTTAGRPGPGAHLYRVNPDAGFVAGVEVAKDRMLAAVVDIGGQPRGRHTLPTRSADGATRDRRVVSQLVEAVRGAAEQAGIEPSRLNQVVIGLPGAIDSVTGALRYADQLPGRRSPALLGTVRHALGVPVAVESDIDLAAVAEQRLGAAAGCEDFVLLRAEARLGAAIVLGGRLHRGAGGGAGEVGALPVPGAPVLRDAGGAGAAGFQALAGGAAVLELARQHRITAGTPQEAVAEAVSRSPGGSAITNADREARADAGADGAAVLDKLATRLATGLASIVAVLDPQLIVVAGAVANAGGEQLRSRIEKQLYELAIPRPRVLLSAVLDDPVLTGAIQRALAAAREEIFDTSAAT